MLNILIGILFVTVRVNSLVIPANDARIYHTEWNWYADKTSGFIETANPGAYLKVDFTGSSIGIALDAPLLSAPFCALAWTIDYAPQQDAQLPAASNFIQLGSNLDKTKNHSLYLFVKSSSITEDRWYGPNTRVRIMNFFIDDGATLMAPKLSSKRLLAYWDSIGEGVNTNGGHRDLTSNDAHVTWAFSLAQAIDTEISMIGWGAEGYTVGGVGNVPPLWSADGQADTAAWKWLSVKYPRSFDVCPDYIICGHGTNDFFRSGADAVYASALGWMQDIRKTCQTSKVFVIVPFGRFMEDSIVRAYQSFQTAHADQSTILIQLGEQGSSGLTKKGATFEAVDGIHPWYWKSSQLGALLAAEIAPHLSSRKMPFELQEF